MELDFHCFNGGKDQQVGFINTTRSASRKFRVENFFQFQQIPEKDTKLLAIQRQITAEKKIPSGEQQKNSEIKQ